MGLEVRKKDIRWNSGVLKKYKLLADQLLVFDSNLGLCYTMDWFNIRIKINLFHMVFKDVILGC